MKENDMRFKYSTKYNARQAFLRRLKCYWSAKGFPRFNTYIGEIYEIDFGENAGSEFSGRHLAICLSDTSIAEDRMLVIPITTKYEKYNFKDVIECTSYSGIPIKGGVVLNEVRLISKLRVFSVSVILKEDKNDKIVPVGRISITKEQLKRWRTIDI